MGHPRRSHNPYRLSPGWTHGAEIRGSDHGGSFRDTSPTHKYLYPDFELVARWLMTALGIPNSDTTTTDPDAPDVEGRTIGVWV